MAAVDDIVIRSRWLIAVGDIVIRSHGQADKTAIHKTNTHKSPERVHRHLFSIANAAHYA